MVAGFVDGGEPVHIATVSALSIKRNFSILGRPSPRTELAANSRQKETLAPGPQADVDGPGRLGPLPTKSGCFKDQLLSLSDVQKP